MKKYNFVEKMFAELETLKDFRLIRKWSISNRMIYFVGETEGIKYCGTVKDEEYWKIIRNINEAVKGEIL